MEIVYMNKLASAKKLLGSGQKEPMTIDEILELESLYNNGKQFPIAFREYLLINGNGGGTGAVDYDFEMLQEDLLETIENNQFDISRPIFAFYKHDGSMFSFFYLDEDKEDPDCYLLIPPSIFDEDKSSYIKSANNYTFSGLVNESLRRIENNLPF